MTFLNLWLLIIAGFFGVFLFWWYVWCLSDVIRNHNNPYDREMGSLDSSYFLLMSFLLITATIAYIVSLFIT